ncbi:MAG: septal ring lytic transglycosylase RlpA family protein [Gammaproteobacteria bacterium]|nr:septal ring lytic transglycosylase RlpA family protein [Gammaproteobacteria bacterium]
MTLARWRLPCLLGAATLAAAGCVVSGNRDIPPPVLPPPPVAREGQNPPPVPTAQARPAFDLAAPVPRGPGNPPFYEVMGERYFVMAESDGYREQGIASWYGREFHGRKTSNGEVYDMYAISAAHKTLPLPTQARVTHLGTGKSIVVRINDRGPFKVGRIIDLSYGAARELGMLTAGTAIVEVQSLPGEDERRTAALRPSTAPREMYVQVGAFGQRSNAEDLKRRLEEQGIDNVVIRYDARGSLALHRVRIGPVADAAGFDAVVRRLAAFDLGPPQLIVEATDAARPEQAGNGPACQAAAATC